VASLCEPGGEAPAVPHSFPSAGALARADTGRLACPAALAAQLQAFAAEVARRCARGAPLDEAMRASFPAPHRAWLTEYVALFGLGDPDALPCEAEVLRARLAAGTVTAAPELSARTEAWRPFRGYAALHLLEASAALP
jgi:3-methyladenine DNA glycosylase/8-oxoguanine DNA glycosylase